MDSGFEDKRLAIISREIVNSQHHCYHGHSKRCLQVKAVASPASSAQGMMHTLRYARSLY
eukprot:1627596-Amphidinium_carterae.1